MRATGLKPINCNAKPSANAEFQLDSKSDAWENGSLRNVKADHPPDL
jgi:hypothetical protein